MAAGQKILRSWLTKIINEINRLINNISKTGSSLGTLSDSSTTINASTMTTIKNKLDSIKTDAYLSTEASIFPSYSVTKGTLIKADIESRYNNFLTTSAKLICKNVTSNSNGNKSNGTESNEYCSRGNNSFTYTYNSGDSYASFTWKSKSGDSNRTCTSNGKEGYGTCTSNGACTSNGTYVNLRNNKTT